MKQTPAVRSFDCPACRQHAGLEEKKTFPDVKKEDSFCRNILLFLALTAAGSIALSLIL